MWMSSLSKHSGKKLFHLQKRNVMKEIAETENFSNAPESDLISHLLELRQRLIYCVVFFFVALGLCYYISESIFQFLVAPLADLLKGEQVRRLIYTGLT